MSAEGHLQQAAESTALAYQDFHGPEEAREHLLQAMAHIGMCESLWMTQDQWRDR